MSKKQPISFYDMDKEFCEFVNFYLVSINISEIPKNLDLSPDLVKNGWKTSEHLFQAAKFTDPTIIEKIYKAQTPRQVYNLANGENGEYKKQIRPDWKSISIAVMHWVVKEKFAQNEGLKKILLETGDADLVEDSGDKDKFWGNGEKGNGVNGPLVEKKGRNELGKILMKVREELGKESGTGSPETCAFCSQTFNSGTGVIFNNKNYCSNECNLKQQKKDNTSSDSNNKPENEGNSSNSNGSNNNDNNEPNRNEESQETNEPNERPTLSQPSERPESPQQEVNSVKDKLDQVQKDGVDEEEIIRVIKEISETVKNSGDENLKKQKEETEKKLGKEKLREIIREEIKTVLTEERIKPENLTSTVKQKLDELNNNNNNNNNDQATRTEVFNEVGNQSLNKLINEVKKALKLGKKVLESKVAELKKFINSKIDYKQNAYKLQKEKVEKLLTQAQGKLVQNKEKEGFLRLNNPVMWVSGVAIVSLTVGVGLLVVRVRRKRKRGKIVY